MKPFADVDDIVTCERGQGSLTRVVVAVRHCHVCDIVVDADETCQHPKCPG